ncbi:hypothetical protein TFLX_02561 [Thermoflexales bacterium]|nr:hypothetical protein TFLX_02561 [Thermoflexales bacterium]
MSWDYPDPRPGWRGEFDRFMGPGATQAELALELGFALLGGAAMLVSALTSFSQWSIIQLGVAVLLACDIAGGVVTNATTSAKRWYHRAGRGTRPQLQFVALHVVHLIVVAGLFRSGDWFYAAVFSIYLLLAAFSLLRTPLYLQRPLALGLTGVAIVMGLCVFSPTPGLEWFIPLLFLKLLVSHLLREEPYSPEA